MSVCCVVYTTTWAKFFGLQQPKATAHHACEKVPVAPATHTLLTSYASALSLLTQLLAVPLRDPHWLQVLV